jgi:hypothetical protein
LFTVPPSEAVTVNVYFTVGVGASGIGLSFEQEFINRNKENISRELLRRNFMNKVYNSNICKSTSTNKCTSKHEGKMQ